MKNLYLKNFAFVFVTLTVVIGWLLALYKGINLSSIVDFVTLIPNIVTIELVLFGIFAAWGWKWRIFRGWLVPYPDLNGSWVGTLHSNWVNPETEETLDPIPAMLTIKQNFLNISCVMHTGEMKSYSFSEGFQIDKDRQIQTLSYSYSSKPRSMFRKRSAQHDGSAILDIISSPDLKLIGKYWVIPPKNNGVQK
ncbi:MAG: hypothetical protein KME58_17105 [Candidatus Thiodiazotropha sp. (ex Lucina pensylvanica)]|nr:hypothetical protein [Candidatus Thiodiazotropha sp. (ex Lucina pensylvanica)]